MGNPFDDQQGSFYALVNEEGQYSLWPAFADIPRGWRAAYGADTRTACLNYIAQAWTDMRPKSLVSQSQAVSSQGVSIS